MVNNQLKQYNKEGSLARRKNTFEKKKGSLLGFVRSNRSQVNRVLPGFCSCWSFTIPGSVQPPDQLGLGSTCQAGPSLIIMGQGFFWAFHIFCYNIITSFHLDSNFRKLDLRG